jgi:hypothetical protein
MVLRILILKSVLGATSCRIALQTAREKTGFVFTELSARLWVKYNEVGPNSVLTDPSTYNEVLSPQEALLLAIIRNPKALLFLDPIFGESRLNGSPTHRRVG